MGLMSEDAKFMHRAIELALLAEREGNLPVGAVITLHGEVVAEGRSAIWVPKFDATRHAEMEAIRVVPTDLWGSSEEMNLYTTLEPCLMCFGSILLHGIGRVVFGSSDSYGGASHCMNVFWDWRKLEEGKSRVKMPNNVLELTRLSRLELRVVFGFADSLPAKTLLQTRLAAQHCRWAFL